MTDSAGPEPAVARAAPSTSSSSSSPSPHRAAGLQRPLPAPGPTARPSGAPSSSSTQRTGEATDPAGGGTGRPGHQVVLGLFVVLAACVIIVFTVFALAVRPEDRHWVPEMTARYLYMPVVATGLLVAIDAHRLGHPRWWMFLLAAPIPLVNVALAAAWILKWRHAPPGWLAGGDPRAIRAGQ